MYIITLSVFCSNTALCMILVLHFHCTSDVLVERGYTESSVFIRTCPEQTDTLYKKCSSMTQGARLRAPTKNTRFRMPIALY